MDKGAASKWNDGLLPFGLFSVPHCYVAVLQQQSKSCLSGHSFG